MSHVGFSREGWETFRNSNRPGPIHMLNLVALHDVAVYEDGTTTTGAEAYAAYGRLSGPVLERVGGRIVWRGAMEQMLIGPLEEQWDHCFVAEYPSVDAFVAMQRDAEYKLAVPHRTAGVRDSRLIRLMPLPPGEGFGG